MANSIFSTYSTAENRVTSTILAVFEKLNSTTVTRILQVLMEDSTIELIKYENQIKSLESVPDGRIKGIFDYLIETKVVPNTIDKSQIQNHLKLLKYDFSKLLVLTPDFDCPTDLIEIIESNPDKIIWGNFDKIIEGINSSLQDSLLLSEKEKFLLMELKEFLFNERLTSEDYSRKAIIVPAGSAWNLYNRFFIYKCQENRTFQQSSFMGFYTKGQIQVVFPKIIGYIDSYNIQLDDLDSVNIKTVNNASKEIVKNRIKKLKDELLKDEWNEKSKYIILTEKSDPETFKLVNPIINDKTSYSDKGTAFVQKQTYLNIDEIKGKNFTSEL